MMYNKHTSSPLPLTLSFSIVLSACHAHTLNSCLTIRILFCSLDSRGGNVKLAPHAAIASDLGQRLFFSIGDNPKDSRLQIKDVKPEDGGVYRCRIDFFNSPTRNFRHNLTLVGECETTRQLYMKNIYKIWSYLYFFLFVVPPEEPRIFDAQGKEISQMAGPFREGYELFLCCQVRGGKWERMEKVVRWQAGNCLPDLTHSACQLPVTTAVLYLTSNPVNWVPHVATTFAHMWNDSWLEIKKTVGPFVIFHWEKLIYEYLYKNHLIKNFLNCKIDPLWNHFYVFLNVPTLKIKKELCRQN